MLKYFYFLLTFSFSLNNFISEPFPTDLVNGPAINQNKGLLLNQGVNTIEKFLIFILPCFIVLL